MPVNFIDSDSILPDFETHIKVSAGPGAGKTRWLINHIKNILAHSTRLGISRKIACITYTNVAVETIIKRLGDGAHLVDVTTIHSLLYKHVLKPYAHFIAAEYDLTVSKIKGHEDKILSGYQFLKEWKSRTVQARIKDDQAVIAALKALRWKFDSSGNLVINTPYPFKADGYSIKAASYLTYKKMAWEKGVVHHDDVLFLSFELIRRFPFILKVLRAKFPYFLIDEFQDVNPIQLQIINKISIEETMLCVVGDNAQSIYSFMGAVHDQFKSFTISGLIDYEIKDNWRSTDAIVNLLNSIRSDLVQVGMRKIEGNQPVILVGDKLAALSYIKNISTSFDICTLARDNIITNSIRKGISTTISTDLIKELYKNDSSSPRTKTIISCLRAVEYAQQGYFKDAIKEASQLNSINEEFDSKKKGLEILKALLNGESSYINGSIMDFYEYITSAEIAQLPKITGAKTKLFYTNTLYKEISSAVKPLNESLPFRTVHKAKGDEFDTVLLVLSVDDKGVFDESTELGFLISPDLFNEENRIKYVAVSRAKNNLYINVPTLSTQSRNSLNNMGFIVNVLN